MRLQMKRGKALPWIAAVCLLIGASIIPVYAGQSASSDQNSKGGSTLEQDGMDIDRGSYSGTQFTESHSLQGANGTKVNFWISNTGNVSVKISINGEHEKTLAPGENGYISAPVDTHSKDYKCKAIPTPNGGHISIDYRIAQRSQEALFDESVSGGPSYVTVDLTPRTDGDLNVYFKNEGSGATDVKLEKKGLLGKWSNVSPSKKKKAASFSVSSGEENYQTYHASSRNSYRVELVTPTGSDIYGRLRVKQK